MIQGKLEKFIYPRGIKLFASHDFILSLEWSHNNHFMKKIYPSKHFYVYQVKCCLYSSENYKSELFEFEINHYSVFALFPNMYARKQKNLRLQKPVYTITAKIIDSQSRIQ